MPQTAQGSFDVKNTSLAGDETLAGTAIGRFGLDKTYHGDLHATARGEMLGAGDPARGTAGYVAVEEVTGTLHGCSGSFALQHFGAMSAGNFELKVCVVPGSGKDGLAGITGTMAFTKDAGKHSYKLEYELGEAVHE